MSFRARNQRRPTGHRSGPPAMACVFPIDYDSVTIRLRYTGHRISQAADLHIQLCVRPFLWAYSTRVPSCAPLCVSVPSFHAPYEQHLVYTALFKDERSRTKTERVASVASLSAVASLAATAALLWLRRAPRQQWTGAGAARRAQTRLRRLARSHEVYLPFASLRPLPHCARRRRPPPPYSSRRPRYHSHRGDPPWPRPHSRLRTPK